MPNGQAYLACKPGEDRIGRDRWAVRSPPKEFEYGRGHVHELTGRIGAIRVEALLTPGRPAKNSDK